MKKILNNFFRKKDISNDEAISDFKTKQDTEKVDVKAKDKEKVEEKSHQKLIFGDSEYLFDKLPSEAKKLIIGLKTADSQTKIYEDKIKLINISKNKMITDLKNILNNLELIQKNNPV